MTTICDDLRKAVLQAAIQGKLTQQLPEDGNAEDLYKEIQAEKQKLIKEGKIKKEKPLSEITEKEIPFDIPDNWKWVRLTDILVQQPSNGFSPKNVSNKTDYKKLTLTATTSGKFKEVWNYVNISAGQAEKYFLKKDDLLIQRSNSREFVGTVCIYTGCDDAFIFPDLMMRMRCIDNVDLQYIYTALRAPTAKAYFSDKASGTSESMPKINQEIVKMTAVPLPPLAEQKRIVARVDELMAKIDEMEQTEKDITALYEAFPGDMKASLLQAAIQGELTEQLPEDGNAEDLYKAIYAEKQKLIKEGKIKKEKPLPEIAEKEIPFVIPENWKWVRLQELGSDFADGPFGSNLKKEHYTTRPEVRIVQLSNIGENGWRNENEKYTTFNHLKTIQRSEVNPGDIVIAKMMPAGRAIILPDLGTKYVLSSDGVKVVPLTKIFCPWLLYAINSTVFRNQIYSEVQGVTRIRTSLSKLKTYLLPLPPLAEQKRIAEKLDQLLPLCDAMRADISGGVGA